LEVIILGSGTFIPIPERACPSVLVISETEKTRLLLDIGPGTLRQIAKTGLSCTMLDYVLLSHFHPDHTADIIHFLFTIKNITPLFQKPFTIAGPTGTRDFIKALQQAYKGHIHIPSNLLEIDELGKRSKRKYNELTIISHHVKHAPESIGFRIEDNSGKSIVYSGDTGICDDVIRLAENADLLILECSLPEETIEANNIATHLSPSDAGKIADEANARCLVLTHIYPECLKVDIRSRCGRYYKGKIIIAKDLLRLHV